MKIDQRESKELAQFGAVAAEQNGSQFVIVTRELYERLVEGRTDPLLDPQTPSDAPDVFSERYKSIHGRGIFIGSQLPSPQILWGFLSRAERHHFVSLESPDEQIKLVILSHVRWRHR